MDLNGNTCITVYCANNKDRFGVVLLAMGVIDKTCELSESKSIRSKAQRLSQKIMSVNAAFCTIYSHLSHCNPINDAEIKELKSTLKPT